MYRDHRKGPGGPPGGATYPGGPHGLKWEGNQPLVGWGAPLGPPPMRLGLGTLGGVPLALGGKATPSPPCGRRPPLRSHLLGPAPPPQGAYIKGGEGGQHTTALGASLLPCNTSLFLSQKLGEALPETRYIHHHAVVLLDLHQPLLPLAGSRRRRRRCTVRVLNAEVPSVRHSVIGDLDHGEYDSVIHVHWNASARDLQGYVDALLSPRC